MAGWAMKAWISCANRSTVGWGAPDGAMTPCQEGLTSNPGGVSAIGVRSGAKKARCAVDTPRARSLPLCTRGQEVAAASREATTCPLSRSVSIGAEPL
jgi:hypothetical protein